MTSLPPTLLPFSGDAGAPTPREPLRLGVVGTLIWDTILDRDRPDEPFVDWGGLSYSLEAFSSALPEDWIVCPLMKVGEDLGADAFDYLRTIPGLELQPGIRIVPFPNPKVELQYQDQSRRLERLEGGVPPWSWEELEPLLGGLDALYVNFITGFEMGLETALHLRTGFEGPLYADLHSLFLGRAAIGHRFPRELPDWEAWFGAFDAVQMNEDEFHLMDPCREDPWTLAAEAVGAGPGLIAVTLGSGGAGYVTTPRFSPDPARWPGLRGSSTAGEPVQRERVTLSNGSFLGDPTGCGDVWGATLFGRLLAGDTLDQAMTWANQMAAKNVEHRGARGLHRLLEGLLDSRDAPGG